MSATEAAPDIAMPFCAFNIASVAASDAPAVRLAIVSETSTVLASVAANASRATASATVAVPELTVIEFASAATSALIAARFAAVSLIIKFASATTDAPYLATREAAWEAVNVPVLVETPVAPATVEELAASSVPIASSNTYDVDPEFDRLFSVTAWATEMFASFAVTFPAASVTAAAAPVMAA